MVRQKKRGNIITNDHTISLSISKSILLINVPLHNCQMYKGKKDTKISFIKYIKFQITILTLH